MNSPISFSLPDTPLVSIIVPVYNAAVYLERCLQSLADQTYNRIEIILVDDCSVDDSKKICETFIATDKRFKYIRLKENSGAGKARQIGIDHSEGDVIGFADGDDWVAPNFVSELLETMQSTACPIVCSQYYFCYDDGRIHTPWRVSNERLVVGKGEALHRMACYNGIGTELWNKLFLREVVMRHPMYSCHYEDAFILLEYFEETDKVCICNLPLYYYNQHQGSLMNSPYSPDKELAHFKLDMMRSESLLRNDCVDLLFFNRSVRKGVKLVKNLSLLPASDNINRLRMETLSLFHSISKRLYRKLSLKNRTEVWMLLHMHTLYSGIYKGCVRHFYQKKITRLEHKYNMTSAQFLEQGSR